jgi:hypothetical protein
VAVREETEANAVHVDDQGVDSISPDLPAETDGSTNEQIYLDRKHGIDLVEAANYKLCRESTHEVRYDAAVSLTEDANLGMPEEAKGRWNERHTAAASPTRIGSTARRKNSTSARKSPRYNPNITSRDEPFASRK